MCIRLLQKQLRYLEWWLPLTTKTKLYSANAPDDIRWCYEVGRLNDITKWMRSSQKLSNLDKWTNHKPQMQCVPEKTCFLALLLAISTDLNENVRHYSRRHAKSTCLKIICLSVKYFLLQAVMYRERGKVLQLSDFPLKVNIKWNENKLN